MATRAVGVATRHDAVDSVRRRSSEATSSSSDEQAVRLVLGNVGWLEPLRRGGAHLDHVDGQTAHAR